MKRIIYIILAGFVFTQFSCKEMDSIYKEYIVPNGITYPGKALKPVVYAGKNRVKISWFRGPDPKVVKARIYWNNYTDSADVDVPSGKDTISYIVGNLPENTYSFFIKTFDKKGNVSIPVEVMGASYGEKYQASLLNRAIDVCTLNGTTATINWGAIDTISAYVTEIQFVNTEGIKQTRYISSNNTVSIITDIKQETSFSYRTAYVPNHFAIDTFYTSSTENKEFLLDRKTWSVIGFSTQHAGTANLATNVIDGNPGTRWHTNATTSTYPHFVTIDMGIEQTVTAFKIYRMTNDDRGCDTFQLKVSTDNVSWTDLGVFNFNRLINDGQYYEIPSRPKGRYFTLIGLTGPQKYMVLGDISAYGL